MPGVLASLSAGPGELLTMYVEPASFPGRTNELLSEAPLTAYAEEVDESASSEAVIREALNNSLSEIMKSVAFTF